MKIRTLFVMTASLSFMLTGCQGQNRGIAANSSAASTTGGSTTILPSATYQTTPLTMNASTTVKTLTWNLANQMQGTSPVPGGGTFSITVQEVTSGSGELDYQFGNPTVTGGSTALLVQNVGFIVNGQTVSLATVLIGINRMIPAGASRVLSTTTQVIPVSQYGATAFAATDTVALTFGNLAPTVFNPPTYTQLKSSTGIFGQYCLSCHTGASAQAGLDLTSYTKIIDTPIGGYFPAVAYNPNDSLIIMTMSSVSGFPSMPPSGTLTTSQTQQVYDWINDGAPNN